MHKPTLTLILTLLCGCSVFPHTKKDLIAQGTHSQEYCLADTRAVVQERVKTYLNHCFHSVYIPLANGGTINETMVLNDSSDSSSTDIVLWGPSIYGDQYYLDVALADAGNSCKTTMNISASWTFTRRFDDLERSAKGDEPWCF